MIEAQRAPVGRGRAVASDSLPALVALLRTWAVVRHTEHTDAAGYGRFFVELNRLGNQMVAADVASSRDLRALRFLSRFLQDTDRDYTDAIYAGIRRLDRLDRAKADRAGAQP